ncbi:MAG TPA: YhbY family RNA-binding protein [Methanocorpusculum sp.]|nr:YhbY family RNA-binding protein [Methanocorpusculum sp.]
MKNRKIGEIITSPEKNYIQTLKPTIWVGKNGCTENLTEEVKHQLEVRKVVKIKWLQNVDMTSEDVTALAKHVSADVLTVCGKTTVLGAKNRNKSEPILVQKPRLKKRERSTSSRRHTKNVYWR